MCTCGYADPFVLTFLFKVYCLSLYGCTFWTLSSQALSHLQVAINKVLWRIWHLPPYSYTSIVLCTAGISLHNIILHQFNKFIFQCLDSDICLVRYIIIDSLKFAYSFIGYNHLMVIFIGKNFFLIILIFMHLTTIRC